jgi:hypothetical protein
MGLAPGWTLMPNADYITQANAADILDRVTGLSLKTAYVEGEKGLHLIFDGGYVLIITGEFVCISAGRLEDSGPLH